MNYIGSKYKLRNFIKETIYSVAGQNLSDKVFCDIFAGTGIIGRSFKQEVKKVISNDIEYYSFVLNKNYIQNNKPIKDEEFIERLNNLTPQEGFIFKHYCKGGGKNRQYFLDNNGKRIDAIRIKLKEWKENKIIDINLYWFLLASLLEAADKVANTASVYGAYLKHLKKSAQKDLVLIPAKYEIDNNNHQVFNTNANLLIKRIKGFILYLDPPYNSRQYGANYHLLNTIAKYRNFIPNGKTGLPYYKKSKYCSKNYVKEEFEKLVKHANFKYIFLSYNNEGLMCANDIKNIMSKYGRFDIASTSYQRFKADKDENRKHIANNTKEYLYILEKL